MFAEMEELLNPSMNYKKLRETIQKAVEENKNKTNKKAKKKSRGVNNEIESKINKIKEQIKSSERMSSGGEDTTDLDFSESISQFDLPSLNFSFPVLPYFGLCLQDIIFIEESNENYTRDSLINFQKFSMIQKVVDLVSFAKFSNFSFPHNPTLLEHLFTYVPLSEEECLEKSKNLEK